VVKVAVVQAVQILELTQQVAQLIQVVVAVAVNILAVERAQVPAVLAL
jgi:hypothetical protein